MHRKYAVESLRAAAARVSDDSEASREVLDIAIAEDVSLFEAADIRLARRRPRWLDRLQAQDRTGEIRHNG